jgi:hypothetical protein
MTLYEWGHREQGDFSYLFNESELYDKFGFFDWEKASGWVDKQEFITWVSNVDLRFSNYTKNFFLSSDILMYWFYPFTIPLYFIEKIRIKKFLENYPEYLI